MHEYTPPLGVPAARKVVCYADWTRPHGEGHNRLIYESQASMLMRRCVAHRQ